MRLYLVQHGLALSEDIDPKKSLCEAGKRQTVKMVGYLVANNIKVDTIWHSAKERAVQTAKIFHDNMPEAVIKKRDDLNPLDAVDKLIPEVQGLYTDLMIVGHLPFLQKLASQLLASSEDLNLIAFKNSGVVCMEHTDTWRILWIVTPELI